MGLLEVFRRSLLFLKDEPKIFVPRIFTTSLYTIFLLYSAKLSLELTRAINREMVAARTLGVPPDIGRVLDQFAGTLLSYLIFFLFVYGVDILTYGMYVRIVVDYKKRPILLLKALREALGRMRTLFPLGIAILVFSFFFLARYGIVGSAYLSTGHWIFALLVFAVLLAALVSFALLFFFAIPVAMIKKSGVMDTLKASLGLGLRHKGPVLKTNFLFVGLILLTLLVAMYSEFRGAIGIAAVTAFVLGRLFQAIVYTYISVVNPAVYLHLELEGESETL
jgi:hypothetical protein